MDSGAQTGTTGTSSSSTAGPGPTVTRTSSGSQVTSNIYEGLECSEINPLATSQFRNSSPRGRDGQDPIDSEGAAPKMLLAFSHISPFINDVSEESNYFNWKKQERIPVLQSLHEAGCKGWFCGHYHRNSEAKYRDMDIVTTGAIGVNILTKPGGK